LENPEGRKCIVLDPGMAFGTGKHETTRACLEFIEKVSSEKIEEMSFLDMGCGSGILSIAASKLGFGEVEGFDVDQEAVDASVENAEKNQVEILFRKFALGGLEKTVPDKKFDVVAANILGPLLIRFSEEIIQYVGDKLIISGILAEIYDEVLSCYSKLGMKEIQRITIGQWTTGLLFKEQ
jgi:ribosomal protein L11 methyltransferase